MFELLIRKIWVSGIDSCMDHDVAYSLIPPFLLVVIAGGVDIIHEYDQG